MSNGIVEPIRVLQIVPAMDLGGLETYIMNLYRAIDRGRVQFDFLYHYDKPCPHDEEIRALGGRIFKLTIRQDNNLPKYLSDLRAFFALHPEYKIIHGHYSGFGRFYNKAAKRACVPVRVGHSHNIAYEKGLTGTLDRILSGGFNRGLTHRFACSEAAGKALFGRESFTVLPNGIDLSAFAFNPQKRVKMRAEMGFSKEDLVFGHVGRMEYQKNHTFLLEVFAALAARAPEARLLLVGDGSLRQTVEEKTRSLEIADKIVFTGAVTNVPDYYHAMDCFLLPSHFEGSPLVLVEAQANGLPCFVSDTIPPESLVGADVHRLSPAVSAEVWRDAILADGPCTRADNMDALRGAGFDIREGAKALQKFYLEQA